MTKIYTDFTPATQEEFSAYIKQEFDKAMIKGYQETTQYKVWNPDEESEEDVSIISSVFDAESVAEDLVERRYASEMEQGERMPIMVRSVTTNQLTKVTVIHAGHSLCLRTEIEVVE